MSFPDETSRARLGSPISRRSALVIAATIAAGSALFAAEHPAGAATPPAPVALSASPAAPAAISPSARADLLATAQREAPRTAEALRLGDAEKLIVKDVIKNNDGTVHTRFERTYAGLPVIGGDLVVHETTAGAITATKATEAQIAVAPQTISATAVPDGARKVVWAAEGTPRLAFETVTRGEAEDGTPTRVHAFTDAATGAKIHEYDDIHRGSGEGMHNGPVEIGSKPGQAGFDLIDDARGGHRTMTMENGDGGEGKLVTDDDDKWGNGTPEDPQTAAVDAAYGAQATWDFYKNTFNRNGIRDDGKGATSRVHYSDNLSNAYWDDECFCMSYGDGAGNVKPLTSIDIAGHEMTHGVTSATAGLTNGAESGALNEATSDIFGTMTEFAASNPADVPDYFIAEKVDINGNGTPLRYMDKPSKDGKSPDFYTPDPMSGHYKAGIANHWFYLLSEGSGPKDINGVPHDSPAVDGSQITAIGRDKAGQIWFKTLTENLVSNAQYPDARAGSIKAAADLFGADSPEAKTVEAAWNAVGLTG